MQKYIVKGTAHASFVMTVEAKDEAEADSLAEKEIIHAIEFNAPSRCTFDVDVSIRDTDAD